jgi:hypothetical protein
MRMDESTDGLTDMMNLIVAFRNFAKTPKNQINICHHIYLLVYTSLLAIYKISLISAAVSNFKFFYLNSRNAGGSFKQLTLILRRSRTGTVWFYTSTNNKRAARPKLYTKSLTRDLKLMYSRLTLVRIYIKL